MEYVHSRSYRQTSHRVKGTMTSAEGVSEFNALLLYKVHIRLEKPIALEKKTGFSFKDESWNLGNGTMI